MPFVHPDLAQKFAESIDFCLDYLCSPKGTQVKIEQPERFFFYPKDLLKNLVITFTNMSHINEFKEAVINDGRSYSIENFDRAVNILNRKDK